MEKVKGREKRLKPDTLLRIEADYEKFKKMYQSKKCYFEVYGYRPTMEFIFGLMELTDSIGEIKKKLKDYPVGTTIKDLYENEGDCIYEPVGFMYDYDGSEGDERVLPKRYEDRYDYEFFSRLGESLEEYIHRMFCEEDENFHLAVKPIEEIIARIIFTVCVQDLEDLLESENFKWKKEDYAEVGCEDEEDEEEDYGTYLYEEDWLYEYYFTDADIVMVLYEDRDFPEYMREAFGIYDYPFDKLFDKQFWGTNIEPLSKSAKPIE